MQYVYHNTYRNFRVQDLYDDFKHKAYNFPKQVTDVITIDTSLLKYHQLNHYPIEYLLPVKVTKYNNNSDYESWTNGTILTEWTDFYLDHEMGVLNFLSTYTVSDGEVYEIIYEHVKINLKQFINHLQSGLRNMEKYFPVKELVEYTVQNANGAESIQELDLTWLGFLDINAVYKEKYAINPLRFVRRGQFLIFPKIKKVSNRWSLDIDDYMSGDYEVLEDVKLPIFIEWSRKLTGSVQFNKNDIDETLNQYFRFAELWYDALLLYIRIEMYMTRLEYNESINVQSLRLNTRDIQWLIQNLSWRLAGLVWDSSIAKWFYKAWEMHRPQTKFTTNLN